MRGAGETHHRALGLVSACVPFLPPRGVHKVSFSVFGISSPPVFGPDVCQALVSRYGETQPAGLAQPVAFSSQKRAVAGVGTRTRGDGSFDCFQLFLLKISIVL